MYIDSMVSTGIHSLTMYLFYNISTYVEGLEWRSFYDISGLSTFPYLFHHKYYIRKLLIQT